MKTTLIWRVTPQMKIEAKELAKVSRRTLSDYLRRILEDTIKTRKQF